jgi:ABC-type multidrug transport system fused ATPase/permease subunit
LTKVIQVPELSVVVFQNFSGLWNSQTNLARLNQLQPLYAGAPDLSIVYDASWPSDSCVEIRRLCSARLTDVNLDLKPGQLVAIVGRSGAGKSSLLKSFVDPSVWMSGSIWVGGRSLKDVRIEMLKRAVVLVPQKCLCFDGTLRQNVDVDSTSSDAELARLLRVFGSETVDLDATVQASSVSASQGLAIGLARAWLRNASVILLDEAIDNMDTINQLKKLDGKVVLAVMHHLQFIEHFDRVVVMAEGKVLEQGPPKILLLDDRSHLSCLMKLPSQ